MTLVIAAAGKDFVILGADSRVTEIFTRDRTVSIQKDTVQKLFKVTKYVGILTYGDSPDIGFHFLDEYLQRPINQNMGASFVCNNLSKFFKGAWVKQVKPFKNFIAEFHLYPPDFGMIVAGIDKEGRRVMPKINFLDGQYFYMPKTPQGKFIIGGKKLIAEYIFRKFRNDMLLDEMLYLVVKAIYDTHLMDNEVGEPAKLAVIDSDGFREKPNDLAEKLDQIKKEESR